MKWFATILITTSLSFFVCLALLNFIKLDSIFGWMKDRPAVETTLTIRKTPMTVILHIYCHGVLVADVPITKNEGESDADFRARCQVERAAWERALCN